MILHYRMLTMIAEIRELLMVLTYYARKPSCRHLLLFVSLIAIND